MITEKYYQLFSELISEVYNKRENKRLKKASEYFSFTLDPGSVDFPTYSEDEIKQRLGQRWQASLAGIVSLVDQFKYITASEGDRITVVYISSTSEKLTNIFQHHRYVSRVVERAKRIGLIHTYDGKFRFGVSRSFSKRYAWNKKAERLLLKMAKELPKHFFEPYDRYSEPVEPVPEVLKSLEDQFAECTYKIAFLAKTNLRNVSDELILHGLRKRYPQLFPYMKKAWEINQSIPESDERILFHPRIKRDKRGTVTKIGIRATNQLVSLKNDEEENVNYNGRWRKPEMEKRLGTWTEIDVKSSVPKVAYLLKTGNWLGNEIDLYALMNGQPFSTLDDRRNYKNIFMSLYFDSTAKQIANHLSQKKQSESFVQVYGKENTESVLATAVSKMEQVIGPSIKSEIFLHESCIYMDVYAELIKRGYRVIQIYDGFFVQGQLSPEAVSTVHEIIKEKAIAYYERYCKGVEKK